MTLGCLSALLTGLLVGLGGCAEQEPVPPAQTAVSPPTPQSAARLLADLRSAEVARRPDAVPSAALISRDVKLRGSAVGALARAGALSDQLLPFLDDEDPTVVAWAAFGLARACDRDSAATTQRVVLSAARQASIGKLGTELVPGVGVGGALAAALAGCGDVTGEGSLRSWLKSAQLAPAALSGLTWWAHKYQRLTDTTLVELLHQAPSLSVALEPIAQLRSCAADTESACEPALNATMSAHLVEVAEAVLGRAGDTDGHVAAIQALTRGSVRDGRVEQLLVGVLLSSAAGVAERVSAAQALHALGAPDGTWALVLRTLKEQLEEAAAAQQPLPVSPVLTAIRGLTWSRGYDDELAALADYPVPKDDVARARRIIQIRCAAAGVLAHSKSLNPRLVACDPSEQKERGALEAVRVLGTAPIDGTRYPRWEQLAKHSSLRVRQAALNLLGFRPEVRDAERTLAAALLAPEPGTVAVAARALRRRVLRDIYRPSEEASRLVETNLGLALVRDFPRDAITPRLALIELAGAVRRLSHRPAIETFCSGPSATLRLAAQVALRQLGTPNAVCAVQQQVAQIPSEVRTMLRLQTFQVTFEFDSGARTLTLYPELAPFAVARIKHLVETGFYVGQTVHRVTPGTVVQFGDPSGDGHGGCGEAPLPTEASPLPFTAGSVGLAQSGVDTGSSQLFVTLVHQPRLYGEYSWLGQAGSGWDTLAEDDQIRAVHITQ